MIANREDIRFECAHCAQSFVVEASGAGVEMSCPVCQHRLSVPDDDDFLDREYGSRGAFTRREETHAELVEALKEATEEKEKLAASATHAQAELKKSQSERQQWRSDLAAHKQKVAAAEARSEEIETQLILRDSELAGARAEIAQTEQELCAAKSEIDRLREDGAVQRRSAAEAQERLAAHCDRLRSSEEARQTLSERCEDLRTEARSLRQDLRDSESGRELLALRGKVAALPDLERLQAELTDTRRARDEAQKRAEAAADSALKQDNEVLRGIIKRQNDEITQRHTQLKRLKRARFAARILYALLAIALLATIAFAVRALP